MSYKLRRALALLLAALLLSMTLSGCGMPAALIDELIEDKMNRHLHHRSALFL